MFLTTREVRGLGLNKRSRRWWILPWNSLGAPGLATHAALTRIVADVGELFISLFTASEVEELLVRFGFDAIVHFGPEEAIPDYLPGRTDMLLVGTERLVIAAVGDLQSGTSAGRRGTQT